MACAADCAVVTAVLIFECTQKPNPDNAPIPAIQIVGSMIDLERDLALERSDDAIKDLSMEIQRDEEKLMLKREALSRIKAERDNMSKR